MILPSLGSRERYLILALLIILTIAAWALLLWFPLPMGATSDMSLTMGLGASLFLAIWLTMMVAMMFPSAAPMVMIFSRVYDAKRRQGQSFVPTWIFISAYLLIWVLFGVVAYICALAVQELARTTPWLADNAARVGGILLIVGGLYQLSPLKQACLAKCRSPLGFILGSWREGYWGSFRMGLEHGSYCLGCCWLLFVILFPLGIMNIAAMAILALLIYAEKILPAGQRISQVAAIVLIAYGLLVIVAPGILPSMAPAMSTPMSAPMSPAESPMPMTPAATAMPMP
jgi:predicted metal-binding membrane protein